MDASRNSAYQIGLNSSPYALGQNFDKFVGDIAKTSAYNLILNDGLLYKEPNSDDLVDWVTSGIVSAGTFVNNCVPVYFVDGASISQSIYTNNLTDRIQLCPNTNYTVMLYTNSTVDFTLVVEAASGNQIFNLDDFTQTPSLSATISPPTSGVRFNKTILQFSTASSASFIGPINLTIVNNSGSADTLGVKYIGLYEGLVELGYVCPKHVSNIIIERAIVEEPSLSFRNDSDTGIFSPGINMFGIATSGSNRIIIDEDGKIIINSSTYFNNTDTLQVNGSSYFNNHIKLLGSITASGSGYFTDSVTANTAKITSNINAQNLYLSGAVTANELTVNSLSVLNGTALINDVFITNGVSADNGHFINSVNASDGFFTQSISAVNGLFLTNVSINGNNVWHAGNQGSGSGLDADLLDGKNSDHFLATTGGTLTGYLTILPPTNNLHAATKQYVDNLIENYKYTFTSGTTYSSTGFTNQVGSFNDGANYFDIFPPVGKTMSNLVAFIPSIAYLYYAGVVDGNDATRCIWSALSDRIRVRVQNTEQRSTPAANWLAVWR